MSLRIQQLDAELTRELGRVVVGADAAIRALVIALIAAYVPARLASHVDPAQALQAD